MTLVTCSRLTAKNRDQPRNPTLGNRVWATFLPFYAYTSLQSVVTFDGLARCFRFVDIYACILLRFCVATVSR